MFVGMVSVVVMEVLVREQLVLMVMVVMLVDVQPDTDRHEDASRGKPARKWLGECANADDGTYERCDRKVCRGARGAKPA